MSINDYRPMLKYITFIKTQNMFSILLNFCSTVCLPQYSWKKNYVHMHIEVSTKLSHTPVHELITTKVTITIQVCIALSLSIPIVPQLCSPTVESLTSLWYHHFLSKFHCLCITFCLLLDIIWTTAEASSPTLLC